MRLASRGFEALAVLAKVPLYSLRQPVSPTIGRTAIAKYKLRGNQCYQIGHLLEVARW
ncbi:MAG: hypothetical protein LH660_20860 [Phormidesmis sp. CAN_BIN36]|nr:hypothetical protein [Phormidesmis sp. CAN_BIN36]